MLLKSMIFTKSMNSLRNWLMKLFQDLELLILMKRSQLMWMGLIMKRIMKMSRMMMINNSLSKVLGCALKNKIYVPIYKFVSILQYINHVLSKFYKSVYLNKRSVISFLAFYSSFISCKLHIFRLENISIIKSCISSSSLFTKSHHIQIFFTIQPSDELFLLISMLQKQHIKHPIPTDSLIDFIILLPNK